VTWTQPPSRARYYGATTDESQLRPWVTRASVLANYTALLQALPDLVSRRRDRIDIARHVDPLTGRQVPETINSLYGASFEVDNTRRIEVTIADEPIADVVRWHGRGEVTLVPCPISWPIVHHDDPVVVAGHDGDLGSATVEGVWTWHRAGGMRGPDLGDPDAFGRLTIADGAQTARLRIDLDSLDPAGAQVAGVKLRKGHGASRVTLRLMTEGGATYALHDLSAGTAATAASTTPPNQMTGTFDVVLRPGAWVDLRAPLWGFAWTDAMPEQRTVRSIELLVEGEPGATAEVADLFLGRPRSAAPHRHSTGPRIGGDAVGRTTAHIRRLGEVSGITCPVEPDGLWSSPPVEPGAWLVEVDGGHRTVVQVRSDRYDLRVEPDDSFYNR